MARTEPTSARSLEIPVSIDSKPLTPPAPPAQEEPAEPPRPGLEVPAEPTTAERLRVVGILAAASLALTLIGVIAGLAGIETYLQWVGATLLIVTVILVALKF